ncbi:MFS transporter [Paenibacillus sp. N1-5-1-14]|uniref:MFS transporter n=1 Tax=Paenibacillus radicibacter TaxID=2972488 RepID=UPI00215990B7|nr:MFS transporter [Paenibacillus radicibacter]MCR8641153.1 MFS transporter [Paenibacillus radicibacter]
MQPDLIEKSQSQPSYLQNLMMPLTKSRPFRLLFLGKMLGMMGSSITSVILPIIVLSLTGSTLAMGTTVAVSMLMKVIMLPFTGVIVDRLDRMKVVMVTDIIGFLLLLGLMLVCILDVVTMEMIYIFVAVFGITDALSGPASHAIRARIYTPDIRNAANSLSQVSSQGIRLLGPTMGGIILTFASAGIGLGIDSLSFLASFICIYLLYKAMKTDNYEVKKSKEFSFKKDWVEGVAVLKSHTWLWFTILAFAFINICFGGVQRVLIPWLFNVHHQLEPVYYGLAMTFAGVGALLAALVFGAKQRWRYRGMMGYGGVLLSGLALFALPFVTWPPLLMGLMILEGFGVMIFGLIWETSLQELVPEEAFGRVVSLDMFGSFALLPLGYLGAGWLAEEVGGLITMSIFAGAGVAIVAVAFLFPGVRKFD